MKEATPPFKDIAIIGVGLIGGSLALALKKKYTDIHIRGCSRTQETLDIAERLGMIDEGHLNVEEAVKGVDLVVLCTPLSTYAPLMEAIAPCLRPDAVITDVGSVKYRPIEAALKMLPREKRDDFVPGHPIAGTEKSGPEAAFDTLFDQKKIILTPSPITCPEKTDKVVTLWESVGGSVELLDDRRHDFIYATVSHGIQLFSSCYALSLFEVDSDTLYEMVKHTHIPFQQFMRLAGSDPVMWRDIFLNNVYNIEFTIDTFLKNIHTLRENIVFDEADKLSRRLKSARKKREHFDSLIPPSSPNNDHYGAGTISLPPALQSWMRILPRLMACMIMESIAKTEYDYATGSGLHGVTQNLLYEDGVRTDDILEHKEHVLQSIDLFINRVELFNRVLISGDAEAVQLLMSEARKMYFNFVEE